MKTIKLKNKEITPVYQALENLIVQGKKTRRGKGKLQKTLKAKHEEYLEDLNDIRSDYFKKEKDGTLAVKNNEFVWLDKYKNDKDVESELSKQIKELNEEVIGINLVEHESKINSFFDALEKDEFTGKEELRDEDFETLMELLEDAFEDDEDNEVMKEVKEAKKDKKKEEK